MVTLLYLISSASVIKLLTPLIMAKRPIVGIYLRRNNYGAISGRDFLQIQIWIKFYLLETRTIFDLR